ncbi:hypothetical protein AAFF_G00148610 [Aldrovandia affinis]|uniref:Uncharacterized protein n=1 Tax=Aldrovandia affinis TaxID=143900 RepID=A0AAD7W8M0_9TELE|nr:hypothetical protein AAFF_G00148610 [Aldrovandia affinis]
MDSGCLSKQEKHMAGRRGFLTGPEAGRNETHLGSLQPRHRPFQRPRGKLSGEFRRLQAAGSLRLCFFPQIPTRRIHPSDSCSWPGISRQNREGMLRYLCSAEGEACCDEAVQRPARIRRLKLVLRTAQLQGRMTRSNPSTADDGCICGLTPTLQSIPYYTVWQELRVGVACTTICLILYLTGLCFLICRFSQHLSSLEIL